MERCRYTVLTDNEVDEIVNQSDFEDVSDSEILTEDISILPSHLSSSESEDNNTEDGETAQQNVVLRGRQSMNRGVRGRARTRGGLRSRGVRTRGGTRAHHQDYERTDDDWKRMEFNMPLPYLQEPSYLPDAVNSDDLLEYFKEYIDDGIIDTMVEKTNQTAFEKTGKSLNFTKEECKIYFGITMLMSCIPFSQIRLYWNRKYALPIIAEAMTRDRYFLLRNSIKIVFDNDITPEMRKADKVWKVRPLLDRILEGCHKQGRQQKISIDEMIIPFTGACPIRQFCPGKPNTTGIKAFVLANPNGLVCDIIIYQGKDTITDYKEFYLGESIVLKLTDSLVPGHMIYFDRYFTTVRLANELNKRGFKCTGTLMKNRIPAEVKEKMVDDKTLMRRGRGSHDVLVKNDEKIAITKWFDNKPVMMLSTIHAAENVDFCRRYNRPNKQFIQIPRPEVIKEYNSNMGGVDLVDRLMAVCPARTRTKKWTVRFVSHCIDLAVTNAWIKYKQEKKENGVPLHKIIQLREFKRQISERLIEENMYKNDLLSDENDGDPEERKGVKRRRPPLIPLPSKIRRMHGIDHLPEMGTIQSRCRNAGCAKKTSVKCTGCNLSLCLTTKRNCFRHFHTHFA